MPHPLDNVVWSALTSRQAHVSSGGELARRMHEDIGPFAALRDQSDEAIAALALLTHADDDLSLLQPTPPAPPAGIALKLSAAGVQMVLNTLTVGLILQASISVKRTRAICWRLQR
jgi:hypothetical protein